MSTPTSILVVAGMSAAMLVSVCPAIDFVCPIARRAVNFQENNARTVEVLELSGAKEVRAQWEENKKTAMDGIIKLEALSASIKATLFTQTVSDSDEITEEQAKKINSMFEN